jgi:Mg-chelatase subunit ChlI
VTCRRRGRNAGLSLVDDDTIELEIVTSRLALAIMDRASWEFADLRTRVATLEGRTELEAHDLLRAHVLARVVFDAWRIGRLSLNSWRELQPVLHEEFAHLVEEAYHDTNRWLIEQRCCPKSTCGPSSGARAPTRRRRWAGRRAPGRPRTARCTATSVALGPARVSTPRSPAASCGRGMAAWAKKRA